MSRVQSAYRNSRAVLIYQITTVLLAFISKKIFVTTLGISFLGYSAVFSGVVSALNLAELGIGFAITSFLYKPLAEKDEKTVGALVYMYKKTYQILGIIVLAIGILASFFLPLLIQDAIHPMGYLRMLFYMTLLGTVSTYYLAYHRTLMIANQKNYVTARVDTVLNVALTGLQIFVMLRFPRYELFLLLELLKNILGNMIVTVICKKQYGFLREKPDMETVAAYKGRVIKFVKDAFFAKIGAYVFYGTDNVIISIFKGSILTGFLSNYTLVVTTVQNLIIQVLSSMQSVLGNYIFSVKDREKEREMCGNYLFLNYFIGNFCMLCIVFLIQPFIRLYFGRKFMLGNTTVFLLGTNLMLIVISQMPSQLFSLYQLYHYDKYIVAVSATLNVAVSVALVGPLGIDGVLIGTFFTSLIYIFSRLHIIWKLIFKKNSLLIYGRMFVYFGATLVSFFLIWVFTLPFCEVTVLSFFLKGILVVFLAVLIPGLLLLPFKTERFFIETGLEFIRKSSKDS